MNILLSCLRVCCITIPIFIFDGIRLLLYVLILIPAYIRFAWYYWVVTTTLSKNNNNNRKVIKYGNDSIRQHLDIYYPITEGNENDDNGIDNDNNDNNNNNNNSNIIVFFCCGGAWIIGYKMWGALLARVLTHTGLTVVIPDYRNYPWGTVPDAIYDIDIALQWTIKNLIKNNNNNNNNRPKIILVGQSAGGHLLMTWMLRKVRQELLLKQQQDQSGQHITESALSSSALLSSTSSSSTCFEVQDHIVGLISLSAPYDLNNMQKTFRKHGMDEHFVDRIFGGERDEYDPYKLVIQIKEDMQHNYNNSDKATNDNVIPILDDGDVIDDALHNETSTTTSKNENQLKDEISILPPIKILQGSCDRTVPTIVAQDFYEQLLYIQNTNVTIQIYDGWTHTDPILEGPFAADHRFHIDIFQSVIEWTNNDNNRIRFEEEEEKEEIISAQLHWLENDPITGKPPLVMRRLCPNVLITLAKFFMPF